VASTIAVDSPASRQRWRRCQRSALILDGEVAIFDEQLVSRFHLLWDRVPDVPATPPMFMAFDCLYVNGRDLRSRPLHERRSTLEEEIRDQRLVLPVRRLAANGLEAWAEVQRRGYEGLVAKERARPTDGRRAGSRASFARRGAS
jgi:bifunctional non-homologous end joining protein LigD